jgi:membrane protease YdiL (CAAX protease family)
VRLVVLIVVFFGADLLVGLIVGAVVGSTVAALVLGVVLAVLALLLYHGAIRVSEKRSPDELRWADARGGLLRGLGLGLVLFAVVIALIAVFGGYSIDGGGSVGGSLTALGVMIAVAVAEELLFRGVVLRLLIEMTNPTWALAISAAVFGLLHLVNPGATIWGALAIAVEAGLMLGAVYVATRSLWLPIGLHLGWNFAQAGIFGVTVSGSSLHSLGLFDASMSGPAVLTGGSFGPEASVIAIIVGAVPTVWFLRKARARSV